MRYAVLAALLLSSAPAIAQESQPRCWLGNMGYSPGATVLAADTVMMCLPDFTWAVTDKLASGCIAGGEFYSVGAVDNGPRSDSTKMKCLSNGTWDKADE
jgi:hypothetical protein